MGSSDNFCLRWNDFESNISTSFRELREDSEFFDVTLCCDNGTDVVQAHKVILAACSPLFRKILSRQKTQQNPFLYLKGIKLKELQAVLNFMYHGEVNVAQDHLNNFLAVAEELAVKGLTTDSKPDGSTPDLQRKKAVAKRKSNLPPSTSSAPLSAKKPKTSSNDDTIDMVEPQIEAHEVDIKAIKAEPEPSGSGTSSGAAGGAGPLVEADLGDESYGGDGDDNGDFGGEEFEGFDSYGDGGAEFDDSMGAPGGSGAADGKVLGRKRACYPIEFKLQVVQDAKLIGDRSAAKKYGIDQSCARKWRNNEVELQQAYDLGNAGGPRFRLGGAGRKSTCKNNWQIDPECNK